MPLIDELGIDDIDPNKVESDMAGSLIPPGKYHAVLDAVKPTTANTGSSGYELEFKILAGPHKDKSVKDNLWQTGKAGSQATDKARSRLAMFMHRLGLVKVVKRHGKDAYEAVEGRSEFSDVIGTETIIEVVNEDYVSKAGKAGTSAKLAFAGVLMLNDPKAKDVLRADPMAAADAKATAKSAAPSPRPIFDDI